MLGAARLRAARASPSATSPVPRSRKRATVLSGWRLLVFAGRWWRRVFFHGRGQGPSLQDPSKRLQAAVSRISLRNLLITSRSSRALSTVCAAISWELCSRSHRYRLSA